MLSDGPRPDDGGDGGGDDDCGPATLPTRALALSTDAAAPTRTSTRSDELSHPPARDPRTPAPLQLRDPARYQILREHGRGGLGRVLRAHDVELRRDVAVKELLRRGTTSELRFFREAMITARLEHPGIVPVHEAGRWPDGTPFYAMKLVQGRPLRELILGCKTLADRLALLPHVIAIADAIAYAHDRRIIHRDLKPSNVIVGAFGETVVIDWGLAKDLTDEIADPVEDGPYRTAAGAGLTVAGSVLGTPAYMPPEQRVGEADERADIYAIGGILYHLLTGEPPHRDNDPAPAPAAPVPRTVPRDLAAIITRAMQADPAARYPSASALADDLRRFTHRRPVAARRYSLTGRAILGMARHRAVSAVLVAAFAGLSLVLALANSRIGDERERAVRSEKVAQQERDKTRKALDDMTMQHAESLLATDPTEALDVIDAYRGPDRLAARRIRATARGMGVAQLRAQPVHGDVMWAQGVGGRIFSLAYGGTLQVTLPGGATQVIARNVMPRDALAVSPSGTLLAYGCDPRAICLFDLARRARVDTTPGLHGLAPVSLSFDRDGTRLAALAEGGEVWIWDLADRSHPTLVRRVGVSHAEEVAFTRSTLAVRGPRSLTLLAAGAPAEVGFDRQIVSWTAAPSAPSIAVATTGGAIAIVDATSGRRTAELQACPGAATSERWLPHGSTLAFACKDGTIGTWDGRIGAVVHRGHLEGTPTATATSIDGSLFLVGSSTGQIAVVDLATGLTTTYRGHQAGIDTLAGPSADWPLITSTDRTGHLRTWLPPQRVARVVVAADSALGDAMVVGPGPTLLATHQDTLLKVSLAGTTERFGPHAATAAYFVPSPDRSRAAVLGQGDRVELWRVDPPVRTRVLETHHGRITGVGFLDGGRTLVTSGIDGRILRWTDGPTPELVLKADQPIVDMHVLTATGTLIYSTADQTLRVVGPGGRPKLAMPGAAHRLLTWSRDERYVVVGGFDGTVRLYDLRSGQARDILAARDRIGAIALSPDDDLVAVATRAGRVYLGRAEAPGWRDIQWTEHAIQANGLVFSDDGELLLAPGPDGIWVYAPRTDREYDLYLPLTNLWPPSWARDRRGTAFLGPSGRMVWLDHAALRARLDELGR